MQDTCSKEKGQTPLTRVVTFNPQISHVKKQLYRAARGYDFEPRKLHLYNEIANKLVLKNVECQSH
jgi:hypothetical protein